MDSVQDGVTDICGALVATQSKTRTQLHGVRLGSVRAPNVLIEFCSR